MPMIDVYDTVVTIAAPFGARRGRPILWADGPAAPIGSSIDIR
jgi:hypothetical protein